MAKLTYGGKQKKTRSYDRKAPTKADYYMALYNRGIRYSFDAPLATLKARTKKEGIEVKRK